MPRGLTSRMAGNVMVTRLSIVRILMHKESARAGPALRAVCESFHCRNAEAPRNSPTFGTAIGCAAQIISAANASSLVLGAGSRANLDLPDPDRRKNRGCEHQCVI